MQAKTTTLSAGTWDSWVSDNFGPFQQSWQYGQSSGCRVSRVDILDNGKRVGVAQLLQRKVLGLPVSAIQGGPVWDRSISLEKRRLPPRLGRRIFLQTPGAGDKLNGIPLARSPTVARWDLTGNAEDLRARMHQKWRNRLVVAERQGITMRNSSDLRWILQKENLNRQEKGYRGLPNTFIHNVCRNQRNWCLFVALSEGARIAAALFLRHGTAATYQIGWNGSQGRRLNAHNLVFWHAAKSLAAHGVNWVDLGVVDTKRAPGLARFKLGTGATKVRFGHTGLPMTYL